MVTVHVFSTFAVTVQLQEIHLTFEPTLQLLSDFGTCARPYMYDAGTASRFSELTSTAAIHNMNEVLSIEQLNFRFVHAHVKVVRAEQIFCVP